jgi:hypothetical protein
MVCQGIVIDQDLPAGKEIVIEFSGPIDDSAIIAKITEYGTKIMQALGGQEVYIEDHTKLVIAL